MVKEMEEKIVNIINELKPYLNSDGGDIDFVKYEDNIVYIKLKGACSGCVHRNATISNVVLSMLQEELPEIKEVKEV